MVRLRGRQRAQYDLPVPMTSTAFQLRIDSRKVFRPRSWFGERIAALLSFGPEGIEEARN